MQRLVTVVLINIIPSSRTLTRGLGARSAKYNQLPWYKKPIVQNAFYTDLQRGSWHIGFYTLVGTREPGREPGPKVGE